MHKRLHSDDEAESALRESYDISVAALGSGHPQTTAAINALVDLYEAWEVPGGAAEWRAKLPVEQEAVASGEASPVEDKQDDRP